MLDQYPVLDGSIMINLILFNPQISCSTPRLRQENRRAQLSDQRNEFLEWSELWRVVDMFHLRQIHAIQRVDVLRTAASLDAHWTSPADMLTSPWMRTP